MTPAEIKANSERFNEAAAVAASSLHSINEWIRDHELDPDFKRYLELFLGASSTMIEASSELIGVIGPLAPPSR